MRVELDKKSLFALASDTRLEILRSLQPMRRTVSQLSDALEIDKAAVHRHLKKMEEGGLVKRFEDHGFVYYGLSWKARDLLSPNENTRIIILLSVSWLLTIAVVFLVAIALTGDGSSIFFSDGHREPRNVPAGFGDEEKSRALFTFTPSWLLWVIPTVELCIAAILLTIWSVRILRKPRQRLPVSKKAAPAQAR